jgi:multimeric flavodoxin WrbA
METLSRTKKIILSAASFPALIFFQLWATANRSPEGQLIAASSMLVYCVLLLFISYRWDKPGYFDWGIAGYFTVISIALLLWPEGASQYLGHYAVTGIYACLFSAALFPLLLGMDPFTYHYAKKSTPPETWNNPIFIKINRIMTFVWSGIFALGIVLSLYPSIIMRAIIPNALILCFGFPFNSRFPDYYLKRLGLPSRAEQRRMAQVNPDRMAPVSSEFPRPAHAREATEVMNQPFITGKEKTMKVLALNSSPRSEGQSKTRLMLDHLVQGMKESGTDVELIDLRSKTVKDCIGCFTCWTKTPGVCIHKDEMTSELYPKWLQSDLVVYATPLYHFTVNAALKAFIERTLPVIQPFLEEREGSTKHPLRARHPAIVMLSVAGFPEDSVFDQLSSWAHFVFHEKLVAEIYRAGAETLTVPFFTEKATSILEATKQAGRELVASMKVSSETMARIKKPFAEDKTMFHKMGNLFWKTCIAEGVTPKEFDEKGIALRPDSIETFMWIMPMGFNPKGAGDTRAVLEFNFSGDVEGSCHFRIENGKIEAHPGTAENPSLTIETPFHVWMNIMTGKADGQQMFMEQKYRVQGDLSLLMRMKQLFGR